MENDNLELDSEAKENISSQIKEFVDDEEIIEFLSSIFKALGDPTRLKIIYALSKSPLCVSDIAEILKMSQSSISHQLAQLRSQKLVKVKRISRKAIYSLDDEHVQSIFNTGLEHALHRKNQEI